MCGSYELILDIPFLFAILFCAEEVMFLSRLVGCSDRRITQ